MRKYLFVFPGFPLPTYFKFHLWLWIIILGKMLQWQRKSDKLLSESSENFVIICTLTLSQVGRGGHQGREIWVLATDMTLTEGPGKETGVYLFFLIFLFLSRFHNKWQIMFVALVGDLYCCFHISIFVVTLLSYSPIFQ